MARAISLVHNISFSHNLKNNSSTSSSSPSSSNYLNSSANDMDHEFDFSVSCDISTEEPSLAADELFSNGMLLPLSSITNYSFKTIQPPLPLLQNVKESKSPKHSLCSQEQETATKASFWNSIARSKSVGTTSNVNKSMFSSICPRSKSTGSGLNQNQNLRSKKKANKKNNLQTANNDKYYLKYSGSSSRSNSSKGVKINPVINVPAPLIPRGGSGTGRNSKSVYDGGLITYLLCNCGYKNSIEMVKA